jgi:membrane-associated HD superfamily phosphohydrolase
MNGGVELMRDQAEHNRRTAEVFSRSVRQQQESFRSLAESWTGAYKNFFSPVSYVQEGLKAVEQTTQQAVKATQQVAQQGLRAAEETTKKTEQAIRETQEATKEAALQTAVHSALKTADYDELSVDDVSKKLDSLSAAELKKVREYEKQNKNRDTLVEQIDRKIKATS